MRCSTNSSGFREDARLTENQRDAAVDDLIGLVGAVDGLLVQQAAADIGTSSFRRADVYRRRDGADRRHLCCVPIGISTSSRACAIRVSVEVLGHMVSAAQKPVSMTRWRRWFAH